MSGSRSGSEGSRDQEHVSDPLLAAFAEGALPQADMRAITAHVAVCDQCAARAAAYAEVDTLLREAPLPPLPPALGAGLYERIQAAQAAQAPKPPHASTGHRRSELETIMLTNDSRGDHPAAPMVDAPTTITSQRQRTMRRIARWTSAVAALIIVGLMASLFAAQHRPGQGVKPTATAIVSQRPCAPDKIQATLPPLTGLSDLVMTGPNDGWAIGSVADSELPPVTFHSLILRYHNCRWAPFGDSMADTALDGLVMASPNEGWATGTQAGKPFLLHYTGGNWNSVTTPPYLSGLYDVAPAGALPDGEVWIVGRTPQGQKSATDPDIALLHLSAGQWTRVDLPLNGVAAYSPVGPNDLWLAGDKYLNKNTTNFEFVHVRGGASPTEYPVAQDVQLNYVHMLSPTDVWAAGVAYVSGNDTSANPTIYRPVAFHYDGAHWTEVNIGAQEANFGTDQSWARLIEVSAGEAWSYTSSLRLVPQVPQFMTSTQHESAGQWTTIPWPFKRVMDLRSLTCVTTNDCWAIGDILLPDKTVSDGHGGTIVVKGFAVALYHYTNGAWSEYGRQS